MKKMKAVMFAVCFAVITMCGCGSQKSGTSEPASSGAAPTGAAAEEKKEAKAEGPTAEKPMVLKFGNSSAPDKLISVEMENFCANVTERTGGAVVCEWYPASQLGNGTAQIEAIMADNQGGTATALDSYSTWCNDLNILSVPFLFRTSEESLEFMASEKGQAMLASLAEDANLKVLNYEFIRLPRVLISTEDITHPENLKGKKFRVANIPLQAKMFEYWGGSVNQLGFSEYPEALMQGVVNAGETSSEAFSTSKFHLYAPYIAEVNFQYPMDCIVMSNSKFEALNSEQQKIILECAQEAADDYNKKCYPEFEAYRPTMIEEGAIFLDIDRDEWIENTKGFYEQLKNENFFDDPGLLDYVMEMRK